MEKLLELAKNIEGLIVFLSADTQYIKEGPVVVIDPSSKSMRMILRPISRNEKQRHLFLVSPGFEALFIVVYIRVFNAQFYTKCAVLNGDVQLDADVHCVLYGSAT